MRSPFSTPTAQPSLPPTAIFTLTSTSTPAEEPAKKTATPPAEEPQLKMVVIRANALEVKQLRQMHLDIVRITPVESKQTPSSKEDFLKSEFIIEAVVTSDLQAKLEAMGFEVSEVP